MNKNHTLAMEMKYEGKKYHEIARELKFNETTVKRWFTSDGLLFDKYEKYRQEMDSIIKEEGAEIRRRNIRNASAALVNLLSPDTDEAIRLRAINSVLDRELGKPKESIEHDFKSPLVILDNENGIKSASTKNQRRSDPPSSQAGDVS